MKAIVMIFVSLALGFGAVLAQDGTDDRFIERAAVADMRASDLMGATVYVTETPVVATTVDAVPDVWESVASVDDFVVSPHGEIRGLLVDVGGFLGIGARTVMVDMDAVHVVHELDSEAVHVVLVATREDLENAREFEEDSITGRFRSDYTGRIGVPEVPDDRFTPVPVTELTVDELTGADVYDRHGDRVTGVSDVVLSSGGDEVEALLIDVGGFLGLFSHTVSVDVEQLEIQADARTDELRVFLDLSEEQLEALPEYQP
jgi:sporulation protein YlmC with PRC-barrel domain